MNTATKTTHESQALPGVKFVVRQLNQFQRARRDESLIDARARVTELSQERERLPDPEAPIREIQALALKEDRPLTDGERTQVESIIAEIASDPAAEAARLARAKLDQKMGIEITLNLKPAYLRAGLVSIEGYTIDGIVPTVDALLESGDDGLLDEIYLACSEASGLSPVQQKNLQSPGTSDEAAQPGETSSTATAAAA
jgi:hypothetical protein